MNLNGRNKQVEEVSLRPNALVLPRTEAAVSSKGASSQPFRMALLAVRRTLAGAQTKAFLGTPPGSR